MGEHSADSARTGSVPRLAPECNPAELELTPAQGYLLSRVDGATPWDQLRQIGGIDPAEVDRCLQSWLDDGVLVIGEETGADPRTLDGVRAPTDASEAPECAGTDPSLDLPVEVQNRIIAFEKRLDLSYYEVLGVPKNADGPAIKRAYFKLSKEFHPDRYFRRDIGPFLDRLHGIFKKVVEAYELLSDPTARAEIDRTLRAASPKASKKAGRGARRPPLALSRSFGQMAKMIKERRLKAKRFFEAGMTAYRADR